jgi:hypothetical protein
VASPLRNLGLVAAALLCVGPVLAGAGFVNSAATEYALLHCTSHCGNFGAIANATTDALALVGAGLAVGGIGLGLLLHVAIRYMVRLQRAT